MIAYNALNGFFWELRYILHCGKVVNMVVVGKLIICQSYDDDRWQIELSKDLWGFTLVIVGVRKVSCNWSRGFEGNDHNHTAHLILQT